MEALAAIEVPATVRAEAGGSHALDAVASSKGLAEVTKAGGMRTACALGQER